MSQQGLVESDSSIIEKTDTMAMPPPGDNQNKSIVGCGDALAGDSNGKTIKEVAIPPEEEIGKQNVLIKNIIKFLQILI